MPSTAGANGDGQLGNGNTTDSSAPVAVDPFTDGSATAVSITAGRYHTCALLNTGAVNCWGYNGYGQLGNNTTTDSSAPVAVAAFTDGRRRRFRSQPAATIRVRC